MRTATVELAGALNLAVAEAGANDAPALLLVHGFTGAKEDFADHLDAFAAGGWHAVAPDLRGHGRSDRPAGRHSYGLGVFAADVLALADALGWERFTLLGHSMGGMVAQHVALDAGGRLAGLVLMDTSHGPPRGIDPGMVELGRAVVTRGGMDLLVEISRSRGGALDTPAHTRVVATRPGYRAFGEAKTIACSPDMWLALVDEILAQPDRLPALARLDVATLVVVGEQDRTFLAPSRRMAEAIPGARLAVIPDAGHSPQFENPQAWFGAVSGFLAGLA